MSDGDSYRHFFCWRIGDDFEDVLFIAGGNFAANFGLEVLVAGPVANVQDEAPDEVGGEASGKDYDENRKSLPQHRGAVLDGDGFDRVSGREPVGEAGAHDA